MFKKAADLAQEPVPNRLRELDILRGFAVILMVLFHIVFDLEFFYNVGNFSTQQGFWYFLGRASAIIFIILSGMMSAISFSNNGKKIRWKSLKKRLSRIAAAALLITLVTSFFDKNYTVYFGILHFLAASALLALPFLHFRLLNIFFGAILMILPPFLKKITTGNMLLMPFGLPSANFTTFDYYPLIPWFGLILWGIAIINSFYNRPQPHFSLPRTKSLAALEWCGRHSLLIYLTHQPIILFSLSLIL